MVNEETASHPCHTINVTTNSVYSGRERFSPMSEAETKRKIVFWIVMGIVAWGIVLAIGVYWANRDPRQPLIILAGVALFVGFWLAMLRTRPTDKTPEPPE